TQGNYALETRNGRVESDTAHGTLKKPSRMVAEGSVLVSATALRGEATDVAPEGFAHPVYRSGFALALPVPFSLRPTFEPPAPIRGTEASPEPTVVPEEPVTDLAESEEETEPELQPIGEHAVEGEA